MFLYWKIKCACSCYIHLQGSEEMVFRTYPPDLLKMRGIFFEVGERPIEIPREADVQDRIMLNLARQDNTFSNSDIHVWRCQSNPRWLCWEKKYQLLDFCITKLCLLLILPCSSNLINDCHFELCSWTINATDWPLLLEHCITTHLPGRFYFTKLNALQPPAMK